MQKRLIPIVILVAYSALVINVLVFKNLPEIRVGHMMFRFGGTQAGQANLVPFKSILSYLRGQRGQLIGLINIVGNIALLVPIGFIVPFVFRNMTWKKALILAIAIGLALEILQAVFHVGIFDIDDVILNALGVMIGYGVCSMFTKRV